MPTEYYTLRDVSNYYGVAYETVRRWVAWGWLRAQPRTLWGQGRRPVLSVTLHQFDHRVPQIIEGNEQRPGPGLVRRANEQRRMKANHKGESDE